MVRPFIYWVFNTSSGYHDPLLFAELLRHYLFLFWPLVVPLGILTYFCCRLQARRSCFRLELWVMEWIFIGAGFGFAVAASALDALIIKSISVPVGAVVGFLNGIVLRRIWMQAVNGTIFKSDTGWIFQRISEDWRGWRNSANARMPTA